MKGLFGINILIQIASHNTCFMLKTYFALTGDSKQGRDLTYWGSTLFVEVGAKAMNYPILRYSTSSQNAKNFSNGTQTMNFPFPSTGVPFSWIVVFFESLFQQLFSLHSVVDHHLFQIIGPTSKNFSPSFLSTIALKWCMSLFCYPYVIIFCLVIISQDRGHMTWLRIS
jgi:hypothetical protein